MSTQSIYDDVNFLAGYVALGCLVRISSLTDRGPGRRLKHGCVLVESCSMTGLSP